MIQAGRGLKVVQSVLYKFFDIGLNCYLDEGGLTQTFAGHIRYQRPPDVCTERSVPIPLSDIPGVEVKLEAKLEWDSRQKFFDKMLVLEAKLRSNAGKTSCFRSIRQIFVGRKTALEAV